MKYLILLLLSIARPSYAAKTVMEGIETSNGTILVATTTKRTDFNGADYSGPIPNVGVYSASNTVVGNCVLYSTGSLTCPTLVGSLVGGNGSTNYYLIGSQQDDLSASANGTQTSFTLSQTPGSTSTVRCVLDGLNLVNPKDFTVTLPNTVVITTAPESNPTNFFCWYNTNISTLPASSSGNMSNNIVNTMQNNSAITYGSGSSDNNLNGSTFTLSGGANVWYMVPGSSQDYSSNCPSTISWSLSTGLQPWETIASSIPWKVHYEWSGSSTGIFFVLNFNNDFTKHYSHAVGLAVGGSPFQFANQASLNSAFGVGLIGDSTVGSWQAAPNLGGQVSQEADFITAIDSAAIVAGHIYQSSILYSGSVYGNVLGGGLAWSGGAVVSSVQLTATSESPQSGASGKSQQVPMCGHYELWRYGLQHK